MLVLSHRRAKDSMETIVKAIPDGYRTITPNITVRDAANARVACIQVALPIPGHVVGFDELTVPNPRSVTNGTEYVAILVDLQELAILTTRHPQVTVAVGIHAARECMALIRDFVLIDLPGDRVDTGHDVCLVFREPH
jgi:hypothetical protein